MDRQYWTSLEDLEEAAADSKAQSDVRSLLSDLPSLDRRGFLKLLGCSLAIGALSGCRKPVEKIIPYLTQPPEMTPGVASWYATTCHGCTAGCGALAKVMDGRPIKLEGNPDHLLSRGGLCATGQGALLGLYDAYRQKGPAAAGRTATWEEVDREIGRHLASARQQGRKVVVLTDTVSGPARRAAIADFLATPAARQANGALPRALPWADLARKRPLAPGAPRGEHVVYDAVSCDAIREGHRAAYGVPLVPAYRFDRADVIVSFGADFLGTWLSPVEFAKQYAAGRDLERNPSRMSRHFQFESRLSLTGSNADYRYPAAPSEQALLVGALIARLARARAKTSFAPTLPSAAGVAPGASGRSRARSGHRSARGSAPFACRAAGIALLGRLDEGAAQALPAEAEERLVRITRALVDGRGRSLVVSGSNDPLVQLGTAVLNHMLGNVGQTVDLARPSNQKMGRDADMIRLIEEMRRGEVAAILIHGCNPAYAFPEADAFARALKNVPCSVSLSCAPDETAAVTTWHCPAHDPMEAWGDAEPQSGRLSLFQPTIRPLYDTRAFEDCLLKWGGHNVSFHDYLRQYWKDNVFPRQTEIGDFESFWEVVLRRGFVEVPPPRPPRRTPMNWSEAASALAHLAGATRSEGQALEIEVFESLSVRDGSAANNPWLQELPDPITKVAWDNCALLAPSLAEELSIGEGQLVEIGMGGRTVRAPAHIQPGQHPRTVSIGLGYGRTHAGPVSAAADAVGVNAYPLMTVRGNRMLGNGVLEIFRPLDERIALARTQIHGSMEGRPIVQEMAFSELAEEQPERRPQEGAEADLWQEHEYPDDKWGMVIDLTKCIGCSACVTACDIENNVAVVGREEVRRQREMHWLRIDRYFTGSRDAPRVVHQPMLCQMCANASCETVCPVLATVHDNQGLNVQVYNRCVGTRYCENNCPYKVRRFNFFNNISNDLTRNLALNPDVTVRSRGVMEKCSFCVQRIQKAKIAARGEGRKVADGEIRTACEQTCPADAIVFGNLADPRSRVSRLSRSARAYRVLEELNRQPSVYYLAKVRNVDEKGTD